MQEIIHKGYVIDPHRQEMCHTILVRDVNESSPVATLCSLLQSAFVNNVKHSSCIERYCTTKYRHQFVDFIGSEFQQ